VCHSTQFVNQVHKGNARVRDTLKLVLKSADQKEKASLISREFFEWMVRPAPPPPAQSLVVVMNAWNVNT
jgi:hypothetical protein